MLSITKTYDMMSTFVIRASEPISEPPNIGSTYLHRIAPTETVNRNAGGNVEAAKQLYSLVGTGIDLPNTTKTLSKPS